MTYSSRLPILMSKFDAARAAGEMKPTATLGTGTTEGKKTKITNPRLFVREFRKANYYLLV